MEWWDKVLRQVPGDALINDSKTPSGRPHLGALRGVLLHDAVRRRQRSLGHPSRYLFGSDDFDPFDELPVGLEERYQPHLGKPLFRVPAPPGSNSTDLAEHFISELFSVFSLLGVGAETYRMRDVYRSGRFDEAIDRLLRAADVVRECYAEVSGSVRPASWLPFHPICERCGRIATTVATGYDGETVAYRCEPDRVGWVAGCGQDGRVSPFSGTGKLPWKLEWAAKWAVFGVTIEGAGKDHTTRGGSRDVAAAILRRVFGREPPVNVPYEFFLVGGAKMSSSRGLGTTVAEMTELLPADVLRYLFVRTPPQRAVEFAPDLSTLTRLFTDFDALVRRASSSSASEKDRMTCALARVDGTCPADAVVMAGDVPPFDTIVSLAQLPHVDVGAHLEERAARPLPPSAQRAIEERVRCARRWVARYADPEERMAIVLELPPAAQALSDGQRSFLHELAAELERMGAGGWEGEVVQGAIFSSARLVPVEPRAAFASLYTVLLGRTDGPRAGNLIAYLDRDFVLDRLRALPQAPRPGSGSV